MQLTVCSPSVCKLLTMSDLKDKANETLTNSFSTDEPAQGDAVASRGEPASGSTTPVLSEPDAKTSTSRPCAVCGTTEPPDAAGLCPIPTCRKFRTGNLVGAVHEGRAQLTRQDYATRDDMMA